MCPWPNDAIQPAKGQSWRAMTRYMMDNSSAARIHVKTDAVFPTVLMVLFLLVYTHGYIERSGVPQFLVKIIIETPVLVIMLHLINRGARPQAPGLPLVALYGVWTVISAIYNGDSVYVAFLYCRYVLYAYIIFAAVWSTPLTRTSIVRVNTTVAALFVFQIAASAYEVFIQGERIEARVGSLSASGGGLATAFPLLAMGLTMSLHLYYRSNLLLLLLSWAYFLVGYASGKRAIYFFGPFLYCIVLTWYLLKVRTRDALRKSLLGILILMCVTPLLLWGVSRSHQISLRESTGPAAQITHAFNAARSYTVAEGSAGRTKGRTATSRRVLMATLLSGELDTALVGMGPAAVKKELWRSGDFMIEYGICGWSRDAISIGWPGMMLYVLFHLSLFRRLRTSTACDVNAYWAALRFGVEICFLVFLICHLTYTSVYVSTGTLSYVQMYLVALTLSPVHRNVRRTMQGPMIGL